MAPNIPAGETRWLWNSSIIPLPSETLTKFRPEKLTNTITNCIFALLIIIVPYRHSIGKCFGIFFHRHSNDKIYSLKLYQLLNFTLHSKANACNIGTCFRFYMQMRVEKTPKLLHIEFIVTSHNSVV